MKNNTKMKVAKKYAHAIELIEKDFDGVWAYTEKGYKFESSDCHTERQDNQKELYEAIRTVVPCDCKHCQEEFEEAEEAEEVEEVEEAEEVEEVEELKEATATVRPAGKKFKYTVTVNGREETRMATKGEYTHIVLIRLHDSEVTRRHNDTTGVWSVASYHKSLDLARRKAETWKYNPASKWDQMPADTYIPEVE